MLTRADEVYRGYGFVFTGERRGRIEAMIFPNVLESGETVGSALLETAVASLAEGQDVLRKRAQAVVDTRIEASRR